LRRITDDFRTRISNVYGRYNNSHGNDLDGVDEENPGASDPDKKDMKFVIFCEYDHGSLGKYVYLTDEEPPTIVHGDDDGPNYSRFIQWEYGGPGAGRGTANRSTGRRPDDRPAEQRRRQHRFVDRNRSDRDEPHRRLNPFYRLQSPFLNSCRVDSDGTCRRLEADCGP